MPGAGEKKLSHHGEPICLSRVGIQQQDGRRAPARPGAGAGIQQKSGPRVFAAGPMGMAGEHIRKLAGRDSDLEAAAVVAVQHCTAVAACFKFRLYAAFDAREVGNKAFISGRGVVTIAQGDVSMQVMRLADRRYETHNILACIAAMNQTLGPLGHEQIKRTAGFGQMVMGVRQNTDFHTWPIVTCGCVKASCFLEHLLESSRRGCVFTQKTLTVAGTKVDKPTLRVGGISGNYLVC